MRGETECHGSARSVCMVNLWGSKYESPTFVATFVGSKHDMSHMIVCASKDARPPTLLKSVNGRHAKNVGY